MQFPLLDLNQNFQFQKEVFEALSLSGQVFFYPSAAMAFQEVVSGYLQFVPHKKSIAVIKGNSDLVNWVLPQFYRLNYNVQILTLDQLDQAGPWMEGLKSDTSCLIFAEDHPITGEKISSAEELRRLAQVKKIPTISLSYLPETIHEGEESGSFARVISMANGQSLVQTSSRFRFYPNYHLTIRWTEAQIQNLITDIQKARQQNLGIDQTLLEKRTKDLPKGFSLLKSSRSSQINLYHPQISGDLLVSELQLLGAAEPPLTTHFCHHESWSSWNIWWQGCPEANILRNLICCSYSFYSSDDNWKKLKEAAEKALKRQTWD